MPSGITALKLKDLKVFKVLKVLKALKNLRFFMNELIPNRGNYKQLLSYIE